MNAPQSDIIRRIARAASGFQQQRTGRSPPAVTVTLDQDILVITLSGALSPAECLLAQSPAGAAQVQEFHRLLFATSATAFRLEIQRITGLNILEAAAEVEPATGALAHAFTSGTMVQIFHFAPLNPLCPPTV
jgi:uncharacterized protein YbcI